MEENRILDAKSNLILMAERAPRQGEALFVPNEHGVFEPIPFIGDANQSHNIDTPKRKFLDNQQIVVDGSAYMPLKTRGQVLDIAPFRHSTARKLYQTGMMAAGLGGANIALEALAANYQPMALYGQQKAGEKKAVIPNSIKVEYYAEGSQVPFKTEIIKMEYAFHPIKVTKGTELRFKNTDGSELDKNIDMLVVDSNNKPVISKDRPDNRGKRATSIKPLKTSNLPKGVNEIYLALEPAAGEIDASAGGHLVIDGICPPAKAGETPKDKPSKAASSANYFLNLTIVNNLVQKSNGIYIAAAPFVNLPKGLSPDYGIDFTLGKRFGKEGKFGIEGTFFLEPPVTRNVKTNIQRDEYTVRDMHLLSETNMDTEWIRQAYGMMLGANIGKPGHVNVAIRGGIGWENHNFNNKFIQTLTDMGSGKIIDTADPCAPKEVSKHNTFYRAELLGVIPISKDKLELIIGYGIEGGRLKMMGVTYDNGRQTAQMRMAGYAHSAVLGLRANLN